jgi:hypothetical protein
MSPAAAKDSRLIVGGPPRADLLPPEIKGEAVVQAQRRVLIGIIALAAIVVVGGSFLATGYATSAEGQLRTESARTDDLIAQQGEYIIVRQMANQVTIAKDAQTIATSTEMDWAPLLRQADRQMPESLKTVEGAIRSSSPLVDYPLASDVLEGPRVGEITIKAKTNVFSDITRWLFATRKLDGYVDASVISVSSSKGEFLATLTIHVDESVRTGRFAEEEEESE